MTVRIAASIFSRSAAVKLPVSAQVAAMDGLWKEGKLAELLSTRMASQFAGRFRYLLRVRRLEEATRLGGCSCCRRV